MSKAEEKLCCCCIIVSLSKMLLYACILFNVYSMALYLSFISIVVNYISIRAGYPLRHDTDTNTFFDTHNVNGEACSIEYFQTFCWHLGVLDSRLKVHASNIIYV